MPVFFAVTMALGVAAPTFGQVINEDLKLLPLDGDAHDLFGRSIAIDNGIVAVGVPFGDGNVNDAGSAYVFDANSIVSCLDLTVENLVAGERATFALSGGTPGARAATVYGTKPGLTSVNNFAGYCATFGIKGVN